METGLESVWVGGACVLLSLGCSVQLGVAVPETRIGFWDGEGHVPASMMFFHGLGFTVAGCAGSRAVACASILPGLQPLLLQGSWKAQDSVTPTCHQHPHAAPGPGRQVSS